MVDTFGFLVASRGPEQKLALVAKLVADGSGAGLGQELLDRLRRYDEPLDDGAPLTPGLELMTLQQTIQDHTKPVAMRRQAIRLVARHDSKDVADYLCGMIVVEEVAALRQEALRQLVKLRLSDRSLPMPIVLLRRQVAREVRDYQRVKQMAAIYRQQHGTPPAPDDPVIGLLRELMQESVEQIFRILMLLYRPEDIHLAYEQMKAEDTRLRADAIELLDNLIDPAMRTTIFPILDEDRFLRLVDEPDGREEPTVAFRAFQEAIWDHNCWLSVTALCAIGRLRISTLQPEVQKVLERRESLVSTAAKIALHLAART